MAALAPNRTMNVFELRRALVDDYTTCIRGFLTIRDARLRDAVEGELAGGRLRPEPRAPSG